MPKQAVQQSRANKPLSPVRMALKGRKQLKQDIEHITADMYRRNKELIETNKTLSLLSTIDNLILDSKDSIKTVCQHIAEAISDAADYPFVAIYTRTRYDHNDILMYGHKGKDASKETVFPRPLHAELTGPWFESAEITQATDLDDISDSELAKTYDYSTAQMHKLRKSLGFHSSFKVKLVARRRIVGMIVIGFYGPASEISEQDTRLICRVSESIGVALDNKLLFEENQRVVRQLRESNNKLRALDEAKDDFVSMASHQLRTPLTSVKGYISMVLEEDAGPVSDMQKQMLTQAFAGSQRMVYLIADLLNVSRLRTGKFMIEKAPVDLSKVISEELDQLQEVMKTRKLNFSYNQPKAFPELMLDETKTRQVIMNFADNAIYYTPDGGTITIALTETAQNIEMRITDSGIGVPKSEQPHLFTKFYRADNARKARPDGTGLGLYMAKKVVIAEGGSLIFESKEGKGSTFGFSFSKARLMVPATPVKEAKPLVAIAK